MSLFEQFSLANAIREQLASMAIEDESIISDAMEGETDIYECMSWLLNKIADEKAMQGAIESRMDALAARRGAAINRECRWRDLLQQAMASTGLKTVKRPEATITLAPKAIGIQSIDESLVPDEFFITETTRKLDKKKLKDAATTNGVAGVLLDNGGLTLRIRV